MRAFFNYIAEAEGRKRWGFIPADATPMINDKGQLVPPIGERTRLITDMLYKRSAAPAEVNPALTCRNPNNVPLAPFREQITDDFHPAQMVEVIKAVKRLASNRAPGPGGITAAPLHYPPALCPYLQALYNAIYRTGRNPSPYINSTLPPSRNREKIHAYLLTNGQFPC